MPIVYEDQLFVVKQAWLGPWRVVDKATGATIAPELPLKEKLGLAWPRIRLNKTLDPRLRRFAEDVLMQTFAIAAVDPKGIVGQSFVASAPEALASSMVQEARERLKLIGEG